ncbi:hypothetical protein ACHAWF_016558 [Thalassiosira exigua]
MKKVDEGVELFDEIYEKVYSAEQQSQKEKYEVELKKEIKKLQRLRDQIKSWISGSEVKDKDSLLDYRRLIETKMEAFKVVEKETKTKTFSKEGLARQEKLDPEEIKKLETIKWVGEILDQVQTLIDDKDLEVEQLSSGKGKRTNKAQIEECNQHLTSHKFHLSKLEGIMRLVRNDRISAEVVDEVKEDLDYYIESHEDDDYMMAYDEECFYEALGLEDLDVVNVDRVTQASTSSKKKDDDATSASSGSKKQKHAKQQGATGMIPLTIGRARKAKSSGERESGSSNEATPTKVGRSASSVSAAPAPAMTVIPAPTPKAPQPAAAAGPATSMAAVLKRESEERQKAQALQAAQAAAAQQAAAEQARQQQQAAELLRQQQLAKQQAEAQRLQQEAALRQQQAQAAQAQQQKAAEALKRQQLLLEQQQAAQRQQQQAQQDAAAKQKLLQQQQQAAAAAQATQQAAAQAQQQQQNVLNVGLSGLALANNAVGSNAAVQSSGPTQQPSAATPGGGTGEDATERYLSALNDSFLQMPSSADSDRGASSRNYAPRNPYPSMPACYPSTPSPIFDNPAIFSKLGTDALFFIFYYSQGTYQQYLAARELKKQSWRYHKKYMTWFQRHEEPKVTTDDYEQGTYVYFDYETGWCQRIKSDFRFEYSFLEDSLSV